MSDKVKWRDAKVLRDRIEELEAKLVATNGALDICSSSWGECNRTLNETKANLSESEALLAKAVSIATLALDALHEVQTYEQPDDPYSENALVMHELDAFDFDVETARTTLAELTGGKDE